MTEGAVRAYVGIDSAGTIRGRYEPHTDSVDELLKNAFAMFGTTRPFTTRRDAELAEALAIHALVKAGVQVGSRQKTVSPSDIQPLLERKQRNRVLLRTPQRARCESNCQYLWIKIFSGGFRDVRFGCRW